MKTLWSVFRPALVSLLVFSAVCGLLYPLVVGLVAAGVFPHQATGSLIVDHGKVVGSELVGQPFDEAGYFWSRPTAIANYQAMNSSGTNLGPLSGDLHQAVADRVAALRAADPGNTAPVPVDLVTASGSGLDPDISPAAAYYQVPRVARARGVAEAEVRALVASHIEERTLGILGERRVNVLLLNRALDARLGALGH
ncbi:MAG TPA: potassium-transporting ATPase subunit KdpC [Kofleriaceae bacterium]|nr:potassium-transporting ATPase subunit KdpC [Kofleriaceae bacterium]